jgi:hypothetical protein
MNPSREFIHQLDREEILRARAMPPEEKLLAGVRLFDRVCRVMEDGIRDEFPEADEAEVMRILRERLAIARRLENGQ